jgi:hypothetical protein
MPPGDQYMRKWEIVALGAALAIAAPSRLLPSLLIA